MQLACHSWVCCRVDVSWARSQWVLAIMHLLLTSIPSILVLVMIQAVQWHLMAPAITVDAT
jgi:hypothetical protein